MKLNALSPEEGRAYLRDLEKRGHRSPDDGNKFNAKPQTIDGVRHDSGHEANWANRLRALRDGSFITELALDKCQLRYELKWNGIWICSFTGDAAFTVLRDFTMPTMEGNRDLKAGERHLCDAKSPPTRKKRDYILVKNMMLAAHGIRILEL